MRKFEVVVTIRTIVEEEDHGQTVQEVHRGAGSKLYNIIDAEGFGHDIINASRLSFEDGEEVANSIDIGIFEVKG